MDLVEEILGAPFVEPIPAAVAPVAGRRPDRIRGMLFGAAVGDALGAPHEFRHQIPLDWYAGRVQFPLTVVRRFQGGRLTGNVGQITDDSEMMIALADSIVAAGAGPAGGRRVQAFCRDRRTATVLSYLAWANSGCRAARSPPSTPCSGWA